MFRLPAARLNILTIRHARAYAAGQPPPNPTAKKEPDNTLMYVALGLAAAGGAYLYFKNPEDVQDVKSKAKREAEQVKQKGGETVDTVKTRAEETLRHGEDQVKPKLEDVRSAAEREKDIGRSIGEDLESKYDAAKGATRDGLAKARDSTEKLYNEARSAGERKAAEEKKGWFSWLRK